MSGMLKGNFKVKRDIKIQEDDSEEELFRSDFKQKVLDSIGGSMVYVERKLLVWDENAGDAQPDKNVE